MVNKTKQLAGSAELIPEMGVKDTLTPLRFTKVPLRDHEVYLLLSHSLVECRHK